MKYLIYASSIRRGVFLYARLSQRKIPKHGGQMQPTAETNASRNVGLEAQLEQVAANLAFLVVQAHRRDRSKVAKSTKVAADSNS
ncbi:hypothetical protein [Blastopirellula marina]|nr:hypothetical protein [Blastopirellula marina]